MTCDAYYHEFTHFPDKYWSNYDKTAYSCEALLMLDNARKLMKNKKKQCFSTLNFDDPHHSPCNLGMASIKLQSFRSLQHFLAENDADV